MALTPTPTGAEMWCRKTKTEQTTAAARINRCHVRSEKKLSKRKDLPKSVGLVERLCYLTIFICISTVAPWRFENPSMWLMFSTLMTLLLCLTFGSCLMACQPSDLSIPLKSVLCYSFAAPLYGCSPRWPIHAFSPCRTQACDCRKLQRAHSGWFSSSCAALLGNMCAMWLNEIFFCLF